MDKKETEHRGDFDYDGIHFDFHDINQRAIKRTNESVGYMRMLEANCHRIMIEDYAASVKTEPDSRNILATGPRIESCRIMCPGKSLRDYEDNSYTAGIFVIACNKAILVTISDALWLVSDKNAEKCDWFYMHKVYRSGSTCFPAHSLGHHNPDFTMQVSPCFPPVHDQRLYPGIILNGATIAGMALQIAFYLGAKTIELCGCDFDGNEYYDGSKADGHPDWTDFRIRMNSLIKTVQHQGVDVYSRTDTTLDVEVRR